MGTSTALPKRANTAYHSLEQTKGHYHVISIYFSTYLGGGGTWTHQQWTASFKPSLKPSITCTVGRTAQHAKQPLIISRPSLQTIFNNYYISISFWCKQHNLAFFDLVYFFGAKASTSSCSIVSVSHDSAIKHIAAWRASNCKGHYNQHYIHFTIVIHSQFLKQRPLFCLAAVEP